MIKLLHWCAVRVSDFAIWLHDKAGGLECWCDERMWRKASAARVKQWQDWMDEHDWEVRAMEECARLGITDEETRAFVFDHERNHATFIKPRQWATEEQD